MARKQQAARLRVGNGVGPFVLGLQLRFNSLQRIAPGALNGYQLSANQAPILLQIRRLAVDGEGPREFAVVQGALGLQKRNESSGGGKRKGQTLLRLVWPGAGMDVHH